MYIIIPYYSIPYSCNSVPGIPGIKYAIVSNLALCAYLTASTAAAETRDLCRDPLTRENATPKLPWAAKTLTPPPPSPRPMKLPFKRRPSQQRAPTASCSGDEDDWTRMAAAAAGVVICALALTYRWRRRRPWEAVDGDPVPPRLAKSAHATTGQSSSSSSSTSRSSAITSLPSPSSFTAADTVPAVAAPAAATPVAPAVRDTDQVEEGSTRQLSAAELVRYLGQCTELLQSSEFRQQLGDAYRQGQSSSSQRVTDICDAALRKMWGSCLGIDATDGQQQLEEALAAAQDDNDGGNVDTSCNDDKNGEKTLRSAHAAMAQAKDDAWHLALLGSPQLLHALRRAQAQEPLLRAKYVRELHDDIEKTMSDFTGSRRTVALQELTRQIGSEYNRVATLCRNDSTAEAQLRRQIDLSAADHRAIVRGQELQQRSTRKKRRQRLQRRRRPDRSQENTSAN